MLDRWQCKYPDRQDGSASFLLSRWQSTFLGGQMPIIIMRKEYQAPHIRRLMMGHWGKFLLLLFTGRSENKFHQQLGANSRYYWVGEEQVPVTVGWTRSKFPDLLSPRHWCHTWHLASTSEYIPSTFPSQLYTTTKLLNNNNNNNNMLDN